MVGMWGIFHRSGTADAGCAATATYSYYLLVRRRRRPLLSFQPDLEARKTQQSTHSVTRWALLVLVCKCLLQRQQRSRIHSVIEGLGLSHLCAVHIALPVTASSSSSSPNPQTDRGDGTEEASSHRSCCGDLFICESMGLPQQQQPPRSPVKTNDTPQANLILVDGTVDYCGGGGDDGVIDERVGNIPRGRRR